MKPMLNMLILQIENRNKTNIYQSLNIKTTIFSYLEVNTSIDYYAKKTNAMNVIHQYVPVMLSVDYMMHPNRLNDPYDLIHRAAQSSDYLTLIILAMVGSIIHVAMKTIDCYASLNMLKKSNVLPIRVYYV